MNTMILCRFLPILIIYLTLLQSSFGNDLPIYSPRARFHPVVAKNGMVVSENKKATEAGLQVLMEGGNAIDAAVTVGFTLAATFPRAGNLGGGGFMLIYHADKKEVNSIDYREKAPLAAHRDMFLDKYGNVDNEKTRYSYLSIGVPGTVAGLAAVLEKYGTIPLKRALRPAIELAEKGFPVYPELRRSLIEARDRMKSSPESMKIFYKENGDPYEAGEILKQKDLAWSLKQIADHGPDAFYNGAIADRLVSSIKKGGGIITKEDLANYKPVFRKPVKGNYRGYEIYSMPPPSSGGVLVIQMLNILETFPLKKSGHNTAGTIHLLVESMKLAFADRSEHLGDPDFTELKVEELLSEYYAEELVKKINRDISTPAQNIKPGNPLVNGGIDTTHFTVMDKYGNVVSNTYTLNFPYGSKITASGTGIILNNEMDDFSAKPGVPNAYGLVGGELNSIEPGKRMLSSMTPTIVLKDGNPFMATGSPGGGRIINTVLQVILNVIDFEMNIAEATNAVRIHHQWLPDEVDVEEGLNKDTIWILEDKGHTIMTGNTIGSAQSIMKIGDYFYGSTDPRRPGGLVSGY